MRARNGLETLSLAGAPMVGHGHGNICICSIAESAEAEAEDPAFRLMAETDGTGRVERVVFLALRGEDQAECFRPVPLEMPAPTRLPGAPPPGAPLRPQIRLLQPGRPVCHAACKRQLLASPTRNVRSARAEASGASSIGTWPIPGRMTVRASGKARS